MVLASRQATQTSPGAPFVRKTFDLGRDEIEIPGSTLTLAVYYRSRVQDMREEAECPGLCARVTIPIGGFSGEVVTVPCVNGATIEGTHASQAWGSHPAGVGPPNPTLRSSGDRECSPDSGPSP